MGCRRFILLAAACVVSGAVSHDGFAQSPPRRQAPEPKIEARPARPPVDRATRLDALFEALKRAPDATTAQAVETRLDAALSQSGSATADLLMNRARAVGETKEYDLSIQLLDAAIEAEPHFAEAYVQRSNAHYVKRNVDLALADLRVALAREPRHYGALAGLGVMLQDIGDHKRALEAFRRALAVHPHIKGISEFIKKLELKVEGREI